MTESTSKREILTRLFDAARVEGVAYLFALITLGRITPQELSDLSGDERHRVYRYLNRLESRGFAVRVQNGRGEQWHPTPLALSLFGDRIEVENLPQLPSSSSSDLIDQSSDPIRSDPEEEEELRHKIYLIRHYGLTGEKAAALERDAWVTPLRLVAWMLAVKDMQRDNFKFTKSPEAYAITCLLRHDEPNESAYHQAPQTLATLIRWLPSDDEEEEEEE